MPIKVDCPKCSASFSAADKYAGQRGACPKCGGPVDVPAVELVEAEPAAVVDPEPTKVVVTGISIPFTKMVSLVSMIVWAGLVIALCWSPLLLFIWALFSSQ